MKKIFPLIIVSAFFIQSCSNNNGTNDSATNQDQKESEKSMNETSKVLKHLPSTYMGAIASQGFDSLSISLTLNPDQNFIMSRQYFNKGKQDTSYYENGRWTIQGDNAISLETSDVSKKPTIFKIISDAQLRMLDSSGNEMSNSNNYDLTIINDSKVGQE